jgi:hypothetical protein
MRWYSSTVHKRTGVEVISILDFGFWILDFGVQFDKLTVRAVTEPVEVQSNDF